MNFRILGNSGRKSTTPILIMANSPQLENWIGIDPHTAPDELLRDLTRNSYEIVKTKYSKKK